MITSLETGQAFDDALRRRAGFSFVRLGDGEGALLRYGPDANDEDITYLRQHFGASADAATVTAVAANLREALATADLIGIRDDVWLASDDAKSLQGDELDFAARYKAGLPLRDAERPGIADHSLRRIFGLTKWLRDEWAGSPPLCSQWVCYDLALNRFWETFVGAQRSIGIVHCAPDLPEKMHQVFNSLDIEFYQVPDKASNQPVWWGDTTGSTQQHHKFEEVRKALSHPHNGKLFLVGAGLVGKGYLTTIKQWGGVALDVGALLDAWDGRSTRPLIYATKTPQRPDHQPYSLDKSVYWQALFNSMD